MSVNSSMDPLNANIFFSKSWRLMPRMLRGVQNRSMNTTALGYKVSAPFGIGK